MNGRKWTVLFLSALLLCFVVWGGINILVDPFGTFGDALLSFDSYSQTLNPRIGKAEYLSRHFEDYDSYIVGSSSAASYLPSTLEKYNGGSYYNMFHYGADILYDEQLISWLLENDDVKHIVLVLGLNEANPTETSDGLVGRSPYQVTGESPIRYTFDFLFADLGFAWEKITSMAKDTVMPQPFDVFVLEEGTYDKRLRDVEPIGTLADYLSANGSDFPPSGTGAVLTEIETCAAAVGRIREMSGAVGTELTVILSPVSDSQLESYTPETLDAYFNALSETGEYWNFSISSVSYDPRYFYDATHTRNDTANMVLACIYGDADAYYPAGFGEINGTAAEKTSESKANAEAYTANIPILLYHHLDPAGEENGTVLHPDTFARQMALLKENGYTAVSFDQLIDYVEKGTPLPAHPVVITFDDGYFSNYEYAFPVLESMGWSGTVFAIGSSVGHYEFYKDTTHTLTPHFGKSEIEEMAGVLTVQSHTYDMHQWAPFEEGIARESILPLEGESEKAYIAALTEDIEANAKLFRSLNLAESNVIAFPKGLYTTLSNVILREHGYKVTLTTDSTRTNCIVKGLSQSLVNLGRLNISADTTDEALLAYCGGDLVK